MYTLCSNMRHRRDWCYTAYSMGTKEYFMLIALHTLLYNMARLCIIWLNYSAASLHSCSPTPQVHAVLKFPVACTPCAVIVLFAHMHMAGGIMWHRQNYIDMVNRAI